MPPAPSGPAGGLPPPPGAPPPLNWRGEFASPAEEEAFRAQAWPADRARARYIFALTGLAYLAGGIGDWLLLGPGFALGLILTLRAAAGLTAGAGLWLAGRASAYRVLPWVMTAYMLLVGIGEAGEAVLLKGHSVWEAAPFTLFIFLTFYLFVPLRLGSTIVAGVLDSVLYLAALGLATPAPAAELVNLAVFLGLVNAMGIYLLRSRGRLQRGEYRALAAERRLNLELSREVAERRKAEEQLRRLATTDELTGVANRRRFGELYRAEAVRAARTGRTFAVLLLDVDHFKAVNDRFGHETGDLVLRSLAKVLLANLRAVDVVARWGGEEFVVLLPETDLPAARAAAERLRAAVAGPPLAAGKRRLPLTVSLGVAAGQEADPDGEELWRAADRALYQAKSRGRNQVAG
ncbi:MAG: GGDEF domain-containing protein [Deltaproteobacteria bacterium]|nr:GGDEF domain-containing protein [Deltaproteobacteria bacterium]